MNSPRIGVVGIPGHWSTEALADAVETRTNFRMVIDMRRVTLDLTQGEVLCDSVDLCRLDGLIIKKISESYSPHVLDRLEMLRFAEARGVRVFSRPDSVLRLIDRLACTVSLATAGVPMPPTKVTENQDVAFQVAQTYGTAVFKPLYSTKARGMALIAGNDPSARDQIAAFAAEKPGNVHPAKGRSVGSGSGNGVSGAGEYLCTYARVSQSNAWNTTIHSGGKYARFEPDAALIDLAHKAQSPFGLDFTTVDVALTTSGPMSLKYRPLADFAA